MESLTVHNHKPILMNKELLRNISSLYEKYQIQKPTPKGVGLNSNVVFRISLWLLQTCSIYYKYSVIKITTTNKYSILFCRPIKNQQRVSL